MWSGNTDATLVWLGVLAGILLLAAGLSLFPLSPWPAENSAGKRAMFGAATSAFLLAAGLAWTYAIIVPPLQAADEPFFLITYGQWSDQPHYLAETREWARQNQFDRIRGNQRQRFRAVDIGSPLGYTADIHPLDIRTRSSLSAGFWQAAGGLRCRCRRLAASPRCDGFTDWSSPWPSR